ncbi:RING-type domain-containing protein [Chloropicon primus]|uniref:RING-type E3 ubiquitin transferase n=1 Tax=Chloropicon primus TaxID=1764295 RepID=A0A5B8MSB6_9CHLO|nr:hypothetical protein A3770_10p58740 [Chloropicon primus]UPR02568.1 RING-type domain-containing protein [Chloropicon primus]|eukprot:QDZ23356.1 hypothetical protein A3770_10p58740 [Chloropicon primus]
METEELGVTVTRVTRRKEVVMTRSCPEIGREYLPLDEVEDEDEEECCCICLECFDDNNPALATKCGHNYHLQCIMQWYQRNTACPMCFRQVELVCEDSQKLMMESTIPFLRRAATNASASASSAPTLASAPGASTVRRSYLFTGSALPSSRTRSLSDVNAEPASHPGGGRRSSTSSLSALKANFRKITWRLRGRSSTQ